MIPTASMSLFLSRVLRSADSSGLVIRADVYHSTSLSNREVRDATRDFESGLVLD